jgi:protein-S-isoprenylcysteine O-methyltransferase Ste14
MNHFWQAVHALHPMLLSSIGAVLTIAQIALACFVRGQGSEAAAWAGWICLWSAGIFGVVPIFTFKWKGGVAQGESYTKTTRLVDTGLYAIVRHPQGGTAWLLISLGLMLIAWHWTSLVLGLAAMALAYLDTYKLDRQLVAKFGDAYRRYAERVPRVNPVVGLVRWIGRQR